MKETKIQAEIVKYLQSRNIYAFSVPNEGAGGNAVRTMQLIAMGLRSGASDLILLHPWGQCTFLEVKTPSGRLSKKQEQFKSKVEANGMSYFVVRSVEDVEKVLKEGIE